MCSLLFKGTLTGHNGPITSVVAPQGPIDDTLFSSSYDKNVIVWDITREGESNYGSPRLTLEGHKDVVQHIALAPVASCLVSASWDKTLRLWDFESGEMISTFEKHTDKVLHVTFTASGRQIVSSSADKTLKLWGFSGRCQNDYIPSKQQQSDDEISNCFCFISDNSFVFSFGKNAYILDEFNTLMTEPAILIATHENTVKAIAASYNGSISASCSKDDTQIKLYNLDQLSSLGSLDIGSKEICALSFSPDNYWLAVGTASSIEIWDVESKSRLTSVNISSECSSLTWSGNGYSIYSGHSDNLIRAWEVERPE